MVPHNFYFVIVSQKDIEKILLYTTSQKMRYLSCPEDAINVSGYSHMSWVMHSMEDV
jgi:hypothetical protein